MKNALSYRIKIILVLTALFWFSETQNSLGAERFHGAVILPADKITWTAEQWRDAMESFARNGQDTVVLAWSARGGRALYPSAAMHTFYDMGVEDIPGTVLALAEQLGMKVVPGLDGTVRAEEMFNRDFEPMLQRNLLVIEELVEQYGDSPALAGFLLPAQGTGLPGDAERNMIRATAQRIHELVPGKLAAVRVTRPAFKTDKNVRNVALNSIRAFHDRAAMSEDQAYEEIIEDKLFHEWYLKWKPVFEPGGPDVMMYENGLADMSSFPGQYTADMEAMRRFAVPGGAQIWDVENSGDFKIVDKDLPAEKDVSEKTLALPVQLTPAPASAQGPARNSMLETALAVEQLLHSRHDLEGQVITYRDTRYHLNHPSNGWQEDACWLTGIYTAAESFRYAATGDAQARAWARRSFNALHTMANVTPVPGVVVRVFNRNMYGYNPDSDHKKRWWKDPEREMYYIADISRDQLSGYFFGAAVYYDLAADGAEKEIIRRDVRNIVDLIIENDMHAPEFTGGNTTYGGLHESPLLALDFLKIAYHVTGDEKYQHKYEELLERDWHRRGAELSATTYNHFFEHFDDSAYYTILKYEDDPAVLRVLLSGLDFLYNKAQFYGNGHLNGDVASNRPWSDAAAMAETELLEMSAEKFYCGRWDARRLPRQSVYVPIADRRPQEYMWCWFPGSRGRQGQSHTEFAGVGYLLAYWMGRYHGFLF